MRTITSQLFFCAVICCALCPLGFSKPDKLESKPAVDDSFWQEELAQPEPPISLSEERIDQFMNHLRNNNPARADELEQLRKQDPEKFRLEIRQEFVNRFHQMRQQHGQGGGQNPHNLPGPDRDKMPQMPGQPGPAPAPGIAGPAPLPPDQPRAPGQQGDNRGQWRERLERMHNELIAWLEKNAPDEAVKLKQLRDKQPEDYVMRTAELMRKYAPIMRAEKDNPKLAETMKEDLEIQRQRDELLQRIGSAQGEEKDKLIAELKTLINRRFDLIIAKKQLQYDDLRKRLEDLQKEVKTREKELETHKANKDKAVEEHLKDLISRTEKVNWDQP